MGAVLSAFRDLWTCLPLSIASALATFIVFWTPLCAKTIGRKKGKCEIWKEYLLQFVLTMLILIIFKMMFGRGRSNL